MAVAVASGCRSAFRYRARLAQAPLMSGGLSPEELLEAPTQRMNQAGIAGWTLNPNAVREMSNAIPMSAAGRQGTNILPPGRSAINQCTGGLITPAFT